jgi:hypothetical protein
MKINKFRHIDDCEERDHKRNLEDHLVNIKEQSLLNTESIITSGDLFNTKLIDNQTNTISALMKLQKELSESHALINQNNHNESINQNEEHHLALDEDLEIIKEGISGLHARSDRTKFFNQKIEENIIILETSDELFSVPQACPQIFNPTSQLKEVNQFFLLSEEASDSRCTERIFNFDTDQPLAIRMDSYSGDSNGFYDAYGHIDNNSSDVVIINDTLFKLRLRMDENPADIVLEDGFSMSFNDIEHDNILSFKRDHTISGYTLNYIVEGKMNS